MTTIQLPPLPWARDALAPIISRDTIDSHYDKHHRTYVEKTNALLEGRQVASLDQLVIESARDEKQKKLFNNAAQVWNHNCYWESLSPKSGDPSGGLAARIDQDFGDIGKLKDKLVTEGVNHFASGWVWLARNGDKLEVISTHDADNALVHGVTPLLTLDVWEHAYYLDYKSGREKHLRAVVEELLNWDAASAAFQQASTNAARRDQTGVNAPPLPT